MDCDQVFDMRLTAMRNDSIIAHEYWNIHVRSDLVFARGRGHR